MYETKLASEINLPYFRTHVNMHVRNRTFSDRGKTSEGILMTTNLARCVPGSNSLLAARRHDVMELITVAGNLDHRAWTACHHLPPLTGSLNPVNEREALQRVHQWHFVGGKDRVIPPHLVESFAAMFTVDSQPKVHVEPTYDHHCCWVENWQRLWRETRRE